MTLQLKPLIKQLTIKDKDNRLRPFDLDYIDPVEGDFGWAQRDYCRTIEREYNAGKPVRVIVLKARQLGLSTVTEAILFWWCFLHERSSNLVVAHQDGPAQNLFNMTKRFWDTFPYHNAFNTQYSTRRQLSFKETGSQIQVATAKNVEGTRGSTISALHGSEVAFWPDAETLWTGLSNTMPERHGTFAALESTANGMGNWFHEQWLAAEMGESEFTPVFYPWWKHPEYRAYHQHVVSISAEEKEILRLMTEAGIDNDNCMAAIAWRRKRIRAKDINAFHQEYPSTPHEAFIMSGDNVFAPEAIQACYDPKPNAARCSMHKTGNGTKVENDPGGSWLIFKKPSTIDRRTDRYILGGDPSESLVGDFASIQVVDRQNLEVVAVYRNRIDPISFADEMMKAGYYYNSAMLVPEAEGGGQGAVGAIMKSNYPNIFYHSTADHVRQSFNTIGWSTNYQRKRWAISILHKLLLDRSLTFHDKVTHHELLSYVYLDNGEMGNGSGARHDDTVMALAIALTASDKQGVLAPYSSTSRPPSRDIFTSDLESAFQSTSIEGLPANTYELLGEQY